MGLIWSTSTGARPATSIVSSRGEKPADLPVQAPVKYGDQLEDREGARA